MGKGHFVRKGTEDSETSRDQQYDGEEERKVATDDLFFHNIRLRRVGISLKCICVTVI